MRQHQFQLRVKTELLRLIHTLPKKIWLKASYIGQGKKLRSNLMFKVAQAIGCPHEKIILPATILELIHTITILHDDVIDNTEKRRGNKTIHTTYKRRVSISSGDYLLSKALEWLAGDSVPAIKMAFFEKINDVCLGEIMQDIKADFKRPLRIKECLGIARAKTGALFAIAYQVPGILTGFPAQALQCLEELGYLHGTIYQLLDDYNDILFDSREENSKGAGFKHWTIPSVIWKKNHPASFSRFIKYQSTELKQPVREMILNSLYQTIGKTLTEGMRKIKKLNAKNLVEMDTFISLFQKEIAPFSLRPLFYT